MKRIGIMGGTFNPIHNGHLAIAERAREQFGLEKVLFLPSGVPYRKNLQEVLPARIRCEMTALAIAGRPYFVLSAIEMADEEQGKNTYTFETLLALRQSDPEADYYFILGADSLQDMEHWKNPDQIFQNCMVLAAVRREAAQAEKTMPEKFPAHDRGGMDGSALQKQLATQMQYLQEKYHASIAMLEIEGMDISSTQIRRMAEAGESIHGLVPESVEHYIGDHQLYQKRKKS